MSQSHKQPRMYLDIETQANPENLELMPEPVIEAPVNYKDPAKIAEYIAEKTAAAKAAAIEKAALDPDYGRILSLGYATSVDGPITVMIVGDVYWAEQKTYRFDREEERVEEHSYTEIDVINEFWRVFKECFGKCVGYNILGFDLPYIMRRSMALGIDPNQHSPYLSKYRDEPTTDLMQILYNWEFGKWKGLKQVAKLYKIPNSCPDVDGSKVKDLDIQTLMAYQKSDVELVIKLYQRMNGIYFNH